MGFRIEKLFQSRILQRYIQQHTTDTADTLNQAIEIRSWFGIKNHIKSTSRCYEFFIISY